MLTEAFPNPFFIGFFVDHCGIIVAVLFLTWGLAMRPKSGSRCWRVWLVESGLSGCALASVDWIFFTVNYGYLAGENHRTTSLLDYLGPWPWYILTSGGVDPRILRGVLPAVLVGEPAATGGGNPQELTGSAQQVRQRGGVGRRELASAILADVGGGASVDHRHPFEVNGSRFARVRAARRPHRPAATLRPGRNLCVDCPCAATRVSCRPDPGMTGDRRSASAPPIAKSDRHEHQAASTGRVRAGLSLGHPNAT